MGLFASITELKVPYSIVALYVVSSARLLPHITTFIHLDTEARTDFMTNGTQIRFTKV
jgi:hypothetical protein